MVEPSQRFCEYLTVGEAAEFLGVSPWTLRNWDRSGKLKPMRHPKNGYRIYRHEDLAAVLAGGPRPAGGGPFPGDGDCFDWRDTGDAEHFVQIYESDAFLVESVGGYVGAALAGGDAAIVVATPAHRSAIEQHLTARGIDLAEARATGQFLCLDAAETLARFMVGGRPDADRFNEVVGEALAGAVRSFARLRAFGEMVALLWAEGNAAAAIRLEELWNELAKSYRFSLFCAYPLEGFAADADGMPLEQVCKCHTRVIPAESYSALATADARNRQVTLLQRRVKSLEAEIAHRAEVEKAGGQKGHGV